MWDPPLDGLVDAGQSSPERDHDVETADAHLGTLRLDRQSAFATGANAANPAGLEQPSHHPLRGLQYPVWVRYRIENAVLPAPSAAI
jgi:hypothetical protein